MRLEQRDRPTGRTTTYVRHYNSSNSFGAKNTPRPVRVGQGAPAPGSRPVADHHVRLVHQRHPARTAQLPRLLLGGVVAAGVTVLITGPFTLIFGLNAPSAVGIAASVSAPALMGWFFARDYSPPMLHGGCRRLRCPRVQAEPSRRPVS